MHPNRPCLPTHRFARLTRWAHLWFVAALTIIYALLNDKVHVRHRLAAMACVLRDLDRHIAQLAKRLRLGLTRRRSVRRIASDGQNAGICLAVAAPNSL